MECHNQNLQQGLIFKTGSLFDSDADCLINPVNTVGVMGSGLAAQFKERYPEAFQLYKRRCERGSFKVGKIIFYRSRVDGRAMCLFPTKEHWKDPSRLEYIESGLKTFVQYHDKMEIQSVAFPKLGCGLGGLNWEFHVKPLMIQYLSELPIIIEVYE
jgi:O-acetyl-ADP-ribose deacetylase (regulator of RNase III)